MNNFPVIVDGKEWWVSRSVAVAVSVYSIKNGKLCILANKRGAGLPGQNFSNPGKWSVVTGFIDYNETLKECAIREVHEETGLDIKDINLRLQDIEDDPARDGQVILIRYSGFIWDINDQELTNKFSEPNEVDIIEWVPINELEKYNWTSTKHIEKIIEYASYECWRNGVDIDDEWNII